MRININVQFRNSEILHILLSEFFIQSCTVAVAEDLIFASTNPQYDDRLFIELQVHMFV